MNLTTRWTLFALVAMFCTACAGMTAAETTGIIAGSGGVLVALSEAILPYLPADKQAQVVESLGRAQGLLNAVTVAMGSVAQAAQQASQRAAEADAHGVTVEGAAGIAGTVGAVSLAASRFLSAKKDEKTGRRNVQA